MSIPEDKKLPAQALALQLPPPLLRPIRKAYPSQSELRGELSITPEMPSSPSPARKVKLVFESYRPSSLLCSTMVSWPQPEEALK